MLDSPTVLTSRGAAILSVILQFSININAVSTFVVLAGNRFACASFENSTVPESASIRIALAAVKFGADSGIGVIALPLAQSKSPRQLINARHSRHFRKVGKIVQIELVQKL